MVIHDLDDLGIGQCLTIEILHLDAHDKLNRLLASRWKSMVLGIIIPAYPSWGVETKKLARASGVGSQFHFSFHARDKARVSVYIAFGEGLNCVKRHGVQLVGICCGFGFRLRHYNNATWNWRVQSWWLWSQRKQHFHKYTFTEQKTTVHAMLLVWTSNKGSRTSI